MPEPIANSAPVTPQRIQETLWSFARPFILQAAVENRVFDVLDSKELNLEEIRQATSCDARGIKSLVEGLAGFGLLERRGDRYRLAPDVAAFLVRGKPGYLGGMISHVAGQLFKNWMQLPQIVRTGKPATAVNQEEGAEFFSHFVEDLFNLNYGGARALAEYLATRLQEDDTDPTIHALDIAAGSAVWSIALAQKMPNVKITALDQARVLPVTRRVASRHHLAQRLDTLEGDWRQVNFGTGYHIAFLGHILHSEGPQRSRELLRKTFDCLRPGGMIAIAEFVVDDDRSGPANSLVFALNMLVHTDHGDAYTFAQMSQWLLDAGFEQIDKVPIPGPSPILTAVRPN